MLIVTSWSRNGEPVGTSPEDLHVPKDALRISPKGAVYVYCSIPVIVTDPDSGKGVMRTFATGSLILRAAPILERDR